MSSKTELNNTVIYFGTGGCINRTICIVDVIEDVKNINDELHQEVLEYLQNIYNIKNLSWFNYNKDNVNKYLDCAASANLSHPVLIKGENKHEIFIIKSSVKDVVGGGDSEGGIAVKGTKIILHKYPKPKRATPKKKDSENKEETPKKRGGGKKKKEEPVNDGEEIKPINVDDPIIKKSKKSDEKKEDKVNKEEITKEITKDKKKIIPIISDSSDSENSTDSSDEE